MQNQKNENPRELIFTTTLRKSLSTTFLYFLNPDSQAINCNLVWGKFYAAMQNAIDMSPVCLSVCDVEVLWSLSFGLVRT